MTGHSDSIYSSCTDSKADGCITSLSPSNKLTGHLTKMYKKNEILEKIKVIMLKVKRKQKVNGITEEVMIGKGETIALFLKSLPI